MRCAEYPWRERIHGRYIDQCPFIPQRKGNQAQTADAELGVEPVDLVHKTCIILAGSCEQTCGLQAGKGR